MGPQAIKNYYLAGKKLRRTFANSTHFEVDDKMSLTVFEMAISRLKASEAHVFELALPAERTIFWGFPNNGPATMIADLGSGRVEVSAIESGKCRPMFTIYRGTTKIVINPMFRRYTAKVDAADMVAIVKNNAVAIDMMLSIIAEPRLVEKSRTSRQQKRMGQRMFGDDVPVVWTTLRWTVGDIVAAKADGSLAKFRMPLHFCRGHWMYLPEGKKGDEWCPIRKRWRSWCKHCWKGHPDYGVRLHNYRPDVDPDNRSGDVIDLVKRRAMDGAKKAAIEAWEQQQLARKKKKRRRG